MAKRPLAPGAFDSLLVPRPKPKRPRFDPQGEPRPEPKRPGFKPDGSHGGRPSAPRDPLPRRLGQFPHAHTLLGNVEVPVNLKGGTSYIVTVEIYADSSADTLEAEIQSKMEEHPEWRNGHWDKTLWLYRVGDVSEWFDPELKNGGLIMGDMMLANLRNYRPKWILPTDLVAENPKLGLRYEASTSDTDFREIYDSDDSNFD